jgi:hypothetical protein
MVKPCLAIALLLFVGDDQINGTHDFVVRRAC